MIFILQERSSKLVTARSSVDYAETIHNFLSIRLVELVMMVIQAETKEFPTRLGPMVRMIAAEATALTIHCCTGEMDSLEMMVGDR